MMPKSIKLNAALRDARWFAGSALLLSAVIIAFEIFDPVRPLWPLLGLLGVVVGIAGFASYVRYTRGPYYYVCGPFRVLISDAKYYIDPAVLLAPIRDLEERWLAHPDTQAVPEAVWAGYTIELYTSDQGPAGRHYRRLKRIVLRKDHHTDEGTLRWEIGHALMYAELAALPQSERSAFGDPSKVFMTEYEGRWMRWRKERDLL